MRHSLNDLYYTPPNSPYYSANYQCPEFVMKPTTSDPMQNLLPVPSLITALCSTPSLATPIDDDQYDPPQSAKNRASQPEGQSDFVDGSGPIFSMYLKMAEKEDEKMVESWKADADGILVFVRRYLPVSYFQLTHRSDWFILCCCRHLAFGDDTGSATEPAGHVQLLPC